ncbi:MAG: type VI secretion system contractile sheath domain-containing protein [Phycisphaerales bacterium JB040]
MNLSFNFGSIPGAEPKAPGKAFRIAVLGDFSARANRGEQEAGGDLASRKGHAVDVDNIDDVVARMGISLTVPVGGERVEIEIGSMDDFHPDELYDRVEAFEELGGLRRRLNSGKWESAAAELREIAEEAGEVAVRKRKPRARGGTIPNAKLSDFGRLMSRPAGVERGSSEAEALIRSAVAPFVVEARDAAQDRLIEVADKALSGLMRDILHDPDFQTVESLWRSVEFLVRRLETGRDLQIVLYDVTAEELAADLASADDLTETGLYGMLVEKPAQDAQQGPLSLIVGCYTFEETPPHAELLGRIAKIAACASAPFLSGIHNDVIRKPDPNETHPLVLESWSQLRALPEAAFLGLACPRFMLRNPYGKRTDPIDPFEFEEFTTRGGIGGMLWANGAVLAALLLAQSYQMSGSIAKMRVGAVSGAGDMPYHFMTDEHGDQVALPCTDRLLGERQMAWVTGQGFIPVLSVRGTPEARIGSFLSVAGGTLAGPWTDPSQLPKSSPPTPTPEEPDDEDDGDAEGTGDEELDALLASLEEEEEEEDDDSGDDDDEMDPELAALLAELE